MSTDERTPSLERNGPRNEDGLQSELKEQACACDDPLEAVRDAARELGEEAELNPGDDVAKPVATPAPTKPGRPKRGAPPPEDEERDPTDEMRESLSKEEKMDQSARTARMISRQLMLLSTLALGYTLYFAQAVFIPIVMSLVLYLLFRPIVQWLCRRRVPAMVSAALCLIATGLLVIGCVLPLVSVAQDWMTDLPREMDRAKGKLAVVLEPLERISGTWSKVEKMANGTDEKLPAQVVVTQPELTGNTVLLSTTSNMLGSLMVVVVLVFFLLTSGDQLLNRLLEQFPRFREKRKIVEVILSVQNGISFYLFTITQINIAMGIIVGLMTWAFGLPNPALWGLMATVFNFVPFIGPAVGGAVVGFVALITFESFSYALLPPLTYYALALIEGNLVSPALIGRKMSLSPIMVLLFLVFWGWMWGIAGAALAVPILAMLKLSMDLFEPTQPAAALLGE